MGLSGNCSLGGKLIYWAVCVLDPVHPPAVATEATVLSAGESQESLMNGEDVGEYPISKVINTQFSGVCVCVCMGGGGGSKVALIAIIDLFPKLHCSSMKFPSAAQR